jgi:hypothetical protein
MKTFEERARVLGHDVQKLNGGQEIDQLLEVADIDQLKKLLVADLPASKVPKSTTADKKLPRALVDKAHDYVFFDAPLSEVEKAHVARSFPIKIRTISNANKVLKPGEIWDLGTSTFSVIVNLGKLTMGAGSSIKIANTALSMNVDTIVKDTGNSISNVNYDLGIFGVTGSTPGQADKGVNGAAGLKGQDGTCGSGGGIAGDDGKAGTAGGHAGNGSDGLTGYDGLPSLTASINIGCIQTESFVISTRSGDGSQGGQGGNGGDGGQGGNGGDGATCACEHTNGGNGAQGGDGGNGGNGGQGGNGVPGNDIHVTVAKGQSGNIVPISAVAAPGNGGTGGTGGQPGNGGNGGKGGGATGCPIGYSGSNGANGNAGHPGQTGKPGTISGNPGQIYINENNS